MFERCHNCKERHFQCHDGCEHYEQACIKNEQKKKEKRREALVNDLNHNSWSYIKKEG